MKKKAIKVIKKKLIASVKKALNANNKSIITTLEKDLKRSIKAVSVKKAVKHETKKKPAMAES